MRKNPGDVVVCLPHLADEDLNVRTNGFVRGSQSQKGMLPNWLGGSRIMLDFEAQKAPIARGHYQEVLGEHSPI